MSKSLFICFCDKCEIASLSDLMYFNCDTKDIICSECYKLIEKTQSEKWESLKGYKIMTEDEWILHREALCEAIENDN